jgi:excisionase family DNA binding protein
MTDRLDAAVAELVAALREEIATARPAMAPERLLDVDEAAAALGVGRSTVYGEIAAGRLRSLHVGRRRLLPASAIAEFIARVAAA